MEHKDLISSNKKESRKTTSRELLQQVFCLSLCVLLLTGCGGTPAEPTVTPVPPTAAATLNPTPTRTPAPTLTPAPKMGTITGMVLDNDGKPLTNIYDQETLVVVLVCSSDDSDIECLHRGSWETHLTGLFDSICEAGIVDSNCLIHMGQGATFVEADGSYAFADIPSGEYGLVFLFKNPGVSRATYDTHPVILHEGGLIKFDIDSGIPRE